jgi:hypothetical protein
LAKKSKKPNLRQRREAKWADVIGKIRVSHSGPKLDDEQFESLQSVVCHFAFPPDYAAFLRTHNGGDDPKPGSFTWTHPDEGERESVVYLFHQLYPGPFDRPLRGNDLITQTLQWREALPRHAILLGIADEDNLLLTFEHGPRDGQVWVKVGDEIAHRMDRPWNPEEGVYHVADSFIEFLEMLREPEQD